VSDSWLYKHVPALDRRVHRLGLAANFGLSAGGCEAAFDAGLNYVFWTPRMDTMTPVLKARLQQDRERMVVATGPTTGWFGSHLKRATDKLLLTLNTDYIDVFQLFWLGKTSAWTQGTIEALLELRESGKVRRIGVSIHDRARAGTLAQDSPLDLLMVRYNAAHPGAEQDIFPHIEATRTATVAYTATRWRKLLKRPRAWTGRVPTAADCYRFCLSNDAVDIVLCGPKTEDQLLANLEGLAKGPMQDDEMAWMREFGRVVHG
jgi:aryl-alcohol dehydrogenase-like predicted oxidoreductase